MGAKTFLACRQEPSSIDIVSAGRRRRLVSAKVVRDVIAEEGFDFFRLVRHEGRQIHRFLLHVPGLIAEDAVGIGS